MSIAQFVSHVPPAVTGHNTSGAPAQKPTGSESIPDKSLTIIKDSAELCRQGAVTSSFHSHCMTKEAPDGSKVMKCTAAMRTIVPGSEGKSVYTSVRLTQIHLPAHSSFLHKEPTEVERKKLHKGIISNDIEGVKKLVSEIPMLVHSSFKGGELPLHTAVRLQHKEILRFLVLEGADIWKSDFQNMSAMEYAAKDGNEALMRLLLQQELPDVAHQKENLGSPDLQKHYLQLKEMQYGHSQEKRSLQHLMVLGCDESGINQFLDKGVDVNQCNEYGLSPMHVAVLLGNVRALKSMVARGNFFALNPLGVSPAAIFCRMSANKYPLNLPLGQVISEVSRLFLSVAQFTALQQYRFAANVLTQAAGVMVAGDDLLSNRGSWKSHLSYWALRGVEYLTSALPYSGYTEAGRILLLGKRTFDELALAYKNYQYDRGGALTYAGLQVLTMGNALLASRSLFSEIQEKPAEVINELHENSSDASNLLQKTSRSVFIMG